MELAASLGFLIFGLGFFVWAMNHVDRTEQVRYDRGLNERREFGYRFEDKSKKRSIFNKKK